MRSRFKPVNGTLNSADRTALNTEMTAMETEINKIADNTEFAGINLGTSSAVTFQVGAAKGVTITHTFKDFDATKIGATEVLIQQPMLLMQSA